MQEKTQGLKKTLDGQGDAAIEDNITQQDILNHFDEKMRSMHEKMRAKEEREAELIESLNKPNTSLRYQEKLYLNR